MIEEAANPHATSAAAGCAPPAPFSQIRKAIWFGTIALEAIAFGALLWLLVTGDSRSMTRQLQMVLSVVALGGTLLNVVYRERAWQHSLRQLLATVRCVRGGELPMDSLRSVGGKLAPAAAEVLELIQELRRQRAAVGALEAELSQRVASRTDALERKLGSLRHQATRDALTGLSNRRMMDEHLPQVLQRCASLGTAVTLLMIDVDNFKHLNDTRGHSAGDDFLRSIGQIIQSTLREADAAFRYGGDEFAVVIEGDGIQAGEVLATRLTSLVDALSRTLHVQPMPRLSIGVASMEPSTNSTAQDLIERADKVLYTVKTARRSARVQRTASLA